MITIAEIIEQVDKLKVNQYTESDKIKWLSELDGKIINEVIESHEDSEVYLKSDEYNVPPYTDNTQFLLIDKPYEQVYVYYLMTKIDFFNAEYERYNNNMSMFNEAYAEFRRFYNREHMPLPTKVRGI